MNAYEIPSLRFSLPAGGAIAQHRFVSINSDGNAIQATASTKIIGASFNEAASGEVAELGTGILMVDVGASPIVAGTNVSADANGKAVPATELTQSETTPFAVTAGSIVGGLAVTGAAANTLVAVRIA